MPNLQPYFRPPLPLCSRSPLPLPLLPPLPMCFTLHLARQELVLVLVVQILQVPARSIRWWWVQSWKPPSSASSTCGMRAGRETTRSSLTPTLPCWLTWRPVMLSSMAWAPSTPPSAHPSFSRCGQYNRKLDSNAKCSNATVWIFLVQFLAYSHLLLLVHASRLLNCCLACMKAAKCVHLEQVFPTYIAYHTPSHQVTNITLSQPQRVTLAK